MQSESILRAQSKLVKELHKVGITSVMESDLVCIRDSFGGVRLTVEVSKERHNELHHPTMRFEPKLVLEFTSHVVDDIKFALELLEAISK